MLWQSKCLSAYALTIAACKNPKKEKRREINNKEERELSQYMAD